MHYGSLEWARSTRGRLVGLERIEQLWASAVFQLRAMGRKRTRAEDADVELALRESALPTTPVVGACLELITSLGPPALVGHAARTYVWGTVLGLRDGLSWDRELFAVAALLHDVALANRRHDFTCFAHDGAEQSLTFLENNGLDEQQRVKVADAICLHLRVEVPASLGVEAHLVHAGAGVDVMGRRLHELSRPLRRAVLSRHPRLDLVDVLEGLFVEERRRHPEARISRWVQSGLLTFIRRNRLDLP
jgi:hypothetical protein